MASGNPRPVPAWLAAAEKQAVTGTFGDAARVVRTYHVWYPSEVAVIVQFKKNEVCRSCTAPRSSLLPHGRMVRFTFNLRTHHLKPAFAFCLVRGSYPSASYCLRRSPPPTRLP